MNLTSSYPVLLTADVASTAEFYRATLGYRDAISSDWYVSLQRGEFELAILDANHETVPASHRGRTASGVIVNLEVDDVDAEHARITTETDATVVLPIRSEAFGQRHFIISGPDGVLIDVITPIPPSPEFAEQFA